MNLEKLKALEEKLPSFRMKQIYHEIFSENLTDWTLATTLPKDLRDELNRKFDLKINHEFYQSKDNSTVKAIITLADKSKIEAVLMSSNGRNTVCVSSQVGCGMGCAFCATGTMGLKRNLKSSEIIEQIVLFQRILAKKNEKVTNIVFMGMGEPFLNLDNILEAIDFLGKKEILGLGMRRFSISTCGAVPGIDRFAEVDSEINLAISLHAATNSKRNQIMPINKNYPLEVLAESLKSYYQKTKRKIMFEYIMIEDFNLSYDDAKDLAKFIHDLKMPYTLNLIPYNKTKNNDFKSPDKKSISIFKNVLEKNGLTYVQRKEFGGDLDAACGQLVKEKVE